MRCFISYSIKTDISVIKKILEDRNISYINPFESFEYGSSILHTLNRQIKDSDFVIAVLDNNVNSAFELGLAMGAKKPVFAISLDSKNKPSFLDSLIYTIAEPTDYQKINYSLEIFLDNLPRQRKKINSEYANAKLKSEKEYKGRRLEKSYLSQLRNLKNINGFEFEEVVANIFRQLELDTLVQNKSKGKDFYADFSLWLDDLNSTIGNPVIIETKSGVNQKTLIEATIQLSHYLSKFNAKVGLLIYNNPNEIKYELPNNYSPLVLTISLQDLIVKLTKKPLSAVIIELRNEVVHKHKS